MNREIKYEEAVKQLEKIVSRLEAGEPGIDQIAEQLKTAHRLIKLCKDKLTKTEQEIDKILEENP
ncbi:MAG: exodeoxyribonuclease VII small subunit [Prevotella sp.]|nr:exodeoxyribonuclease VII small subunit [Prevotella sp.]